jgi:hypothetical protein
LTFSILGAMSVRGIEFKRGQCRRKKGEGNSAS